MWWHAFGKPMLNCSVTLRLCDSKRVKVTLKMQHKDQQLLHFAENVYKVEFINKGNN